MTQARYVLVSAAVCVAVLGWVPPATAVTVTVDGTVVFDSGGFEADTAGELPSVATLGTWAAADAGDTRVRVVDNAPAGGAYQGTKALNFYRNEGGGAGATAAMTTASTPGQVVKVTTMIYLQEFAHPGFETAALSAQFYLVGGGAYMFDGMQFGGGGVLQYHIGNGWQSTGLTASFGQWHLLEIEYVTGAGTMAVALDGASVSVPVKAALSTVDHVEFGVANWYNDWYLDAQTSNVPANDMCANASAVIDGTYSGSTALATADGTASCGSSDGTPDVWYKVTPEADGTMRLSTCGSSYDAVVSVYSSCGGAELACNDTCGGTPCGGPDACLEVQVSEGETYFIRVGGANGATGGYKLNVQLPSGITNDYCTDAIPITDGTYTGTTVGTTQDGSSSCGSASSPDVWYVYTAAKSGELTADMCGTEYDGTLSMHSACPGDAANELSGGCDDDEPGCGFGPLPNSEPKVTVLVSAGQTVYLRLFAWAGATGNYQLNVHLTEIQPPPANDTCGSATPIGNGTFTGSTAWASNDGDAACGNSGTAADVWYSYTATCDGVLSADTCGSTYNTVLSVHSACPGTAGNTLACNDNCGDASTSCRQVPVSSGQTYIIRVSGSGAANGDFTLHTSCGPAAVKPSLPLVQSFENNAVGSTAGWETAPSLVISQPPACADTPPLEVITTDPSPAGGGAHSLRWFEPAGARRSGVGRRWLPPPSSTTGVMKLEYDFKIVQHTDRGLSFPLSGFNDGGTLNLNVYSVRFDSTTQDLPIGWNFLDNGAWNNFIPITDVSEVIGHWFHYSAVVDVGTHMVDLTITPLDAGGVGGHIVGTFQGGNPLDADMANYTGLFVFQSNPTATSEVIFDNIKVEIAGQEACNAVWADIDGDTDVDMDDFGAFQACFTGATTGQLPGCHCFDNNKNSAVDLNDFAQFRLCASRAGVPSTCGE